ncbi:hypothetical protein [Acinetobacter sp. ANC 3791]|uniref:hypothetical protein n=1 Tax=Acinetobacter sp. ANC 3791 TaxID=2529836 RepID=UPI00103E47BE|nr:hypothetical protein [Acinetobacter sp. ANC 3791]TCB83326.1 hypothetical protein E0H90_11395 [Acinetobacter sp. ANC 3791]
MKKIILLTALLNLFGCTSKQNVVSDVDQKAIVSYLTKSEPTVKDAVWSNSSTLKVGVINNGANRDGYAQYICEVLNQKGQQGKQVTVKIIDIQKLVSTNKWETIGEKHCN